MARQVHTLLVLAILLGACTATTAEPEATLVTKRSSTPSGAASSTSEPAGTSEGTQSTATPITTPGERGRAPAMETLDEGQAGMVYDPEGEFLMAAIWTARRKTQPTASTWTLSGSTAQR
jgi:hypothetical protein